MPTKSEQKAAPTIIDQVEEKIYVVRGQRVMLDSDLADVYGVETRRLKEQVRRNLSRFPKDFMFELSPDEMRSVASLRSQIATINDGESKRGRHSKYAPFAFTEHGAVMLASVLNTPTAVEASIVVVRAFVKMRAMLALHQDLADRVEELEKVTNYHGNKFRVVSELLEGIMRNPKHLKRKIGFVEPKRKKNGVRNYN